MSKAPWSSDRELDATRVRALLSSRFPELEGKDVRYLAEGWDSQVFEVDGRLVFRFPKRAEVERDFVAETALLPALERHLAAAQAGFSVPRFDYRGAPDALFPYLWVGYEKLPGVQAFEVDPAAVPVAQVAHLGRALTALHAFPVAEARALGVPGPLPSRALAHMVSRALAVLPPLAAALGAPLAAQVQVALAEARVPEHDGALVLVHNDLRAEHMLLDATSGMLTGVIDWSDAALGDPAVDFVGLECWGGRALTARALAAYGGPVDAGFLDRVRLRALCVGVYGAYFGATQHLPDELARARAELTTTLGAA